MVRVKCKYYHYRESTQFKYDKECILEFEGSITLNMLLEKFKEKMGDNYVLSGHKYGNNNWHIMGYLFGLDYEKR